MRREGLSKKNLVLLLIFLSIALSIGIVILLHFLNIVVHFPNIILVSIIFESIFTTLFVIYFTGIASKYTVLAAISTFISLIEWYTFPYLTLPLIIIISPLILAILIALVPIIIDIYIWVKMYSIFT